MFGGKFRKLQCFSQLMAVGRFGWDNWILWLVFSAALVLLDFVYEFGLFGREGSSNVLVIGRPLEGWTVG